MCERTMDFGTLNLRAQGAATVLDVRAQPRAKRPGLKGIREGALEVALRAPPVDGAANEELVRTLAELLGVPRRAVTVLRGASARGKAVSIEGISPDEVRARLAAARAE